MDGGVGENLNRFHKKFMTNDEVKVRFSPRICRFLEISSGFPKEIKALFREPISGMVILYRKYTLIS